ncbi:MAG: hypothetical protein ACRC1U_11170, partial [Vibrionaceae bacterium]
AVSALTITSTEEGISDILTYPITLFFILMRQNLAVYSTVSKTTRTEKFLATVFKATLTTKKHIADQHHFLH